MGNDVATESLYSHALQLREEWSKMNPEPGIKTVNRNERITPHEEIEEGSRFAFGSGDKQFFFGEDSVGYFEGQLPSSPGEYRR